MKHADAIVRFGEAVTRGDDDVDQVRADLLYVLGAEGFVEAAGIVGIFNGLVRTADASGIPLDDGTRGASTEFRQELGLNAYPGSANTDLEARGPAIGSEDPGQAFR